MLTYKRRFAPLLLILLAFGSSFAQTAPIIPPVPGKTIFPLSQVKEGLRGTARTVFRGSEPEEFGVDILGVIPGSIGPHQDLIIGKLSGANADRTLVFAGMSGSPVYIDGKIVGAISYSFPFAKEAICGITPIEQMVSIFEKGSAPKPIFATSATISAASLMSNDWRIFTLKTATNNGSIVGSVSADSRLSSLSGQAFRPIATPIAFSGISQTTLDAFSSDLSRAGIMAVATTGGGSGSTAIKPATERTLVGGSSVVVQLARGDIAISAAGTVTLRDNDKIYAFGHPYFSLGSTSLPMNESHVVIVVPNANNSFKLAVPDAAVGSLTQDRATGILGLLGQSPKMLPVHLRMTTSRGRSEEINFESAIDEFLTPLIVNVGLLNSISGYERGIGDTTIELNGEIKIRGEESVRISRRFTGAQAAPFAASAPAVPLAALFKSNFEGLDITGVDIQVTLHEGSSSATLERVALDKTQVRAGETVNLTLSIRTDTGRLMSQNVAVLIPADTPTGAISLMIGDGAAVQQNAAIQQFTPTNAAELIKTINAVKRPDRLYALAYRTSAGAIIGSSELPNLPPSMLATLNNDRSSGGTKPSTQKTVLDQIIPSSEYVVSGSQTLAIEIVR